MKYVGKRQSTAPPEEDYKYMGSSKYVPKDKCDKIVLSTFDTPQEAVAEEVRLHDLYDVASNPMFYNKAKQTSLKFDTTGFRFNLTEEQKRKLSESSKGTPKTLLDEQRAINKKRMAQYNNPIVRAKATEALRRNGSNKGVKNAMFKPWYISTPTVTHLFYDISKNEKSIQDGFIDKKHYTHLQKRLKSKSFVTNKVYGTIEDIGTIPTTV